MYVINLWGNTMSMNIVMYIKVGSVFTPVEGLVQTSTNESTMIMAAGNNWKDRARAYLRFVRAVYPNYIVKEQRRIVGMAWRIAEENRGVLDIRMG